MTGNETTKRRDMMKNEFFKYDLIHSREDRVKIVCKVDIFWIYALHEYESNLKGAMSRKIL